jgi:UDP-glucuronate 4-epimerase
MAGTILITGTAGFIGFHAANRFLDAGWEVTGFDGMTDYYDVGLKHRRHAVLAERNRFRAVEARLEAPGALADLMAETRPDVVLHLAAQAGVRYSIEAPEAYVDSNLTGLFRLLEAARAHPPKHLLFASTSSAYGANTKMPYAETDRADHPMSFYAATKKAGEAMTHSYAHLFGLPVTAFRFFTVYGAWGRPDMAYFKFAKAILEGRPIDVYNHGDMRRDFTFVGDLAEAVFQLAAVVPPGPKGRGEAIEGDSLSPVAPWRVVNIGQSQPRRLDEFIAALEAALGRKAERRMLDMQPGDVPATWADTRLLTALIGELPATRLEDGLRDFVAWYLASEHNRPVG